MTKLTQSELANGLGKIAEDWVAKDIDKELDKLTPTWEKEFIKNFTKKRPHGLLWKDLGDSPELVMIFIRQTLENQAKEITVKVGKKWRTKGIEIGKIRKAKEIEGEWKKWVEGEIIYQQKYSKMSKDILEKDKAGWFLGHFDGLEALKSLLKENHCHFRLNPAFLSVSLTPLTSGNGLI